MEGDKKKGLLSSLTEQMKKNKRFEITVYLIIAALIILLCFFGRGDKDSENNNSTAQIPRERTEAELEERLKTVLSEIRGAGEVEVMITLDSTSEIVPALKQSSEMNDNIRSEPATVDDGKGESPIVLTEILPRIRGVIVIAEGAADISVKMRLQSAVETVLGVEANCISVFEMKYDNNDNMKGD